MLNAIRRQLGKRLFYLGYSIMPANIRRGVSFMLALGVAWAKENDVDMCKVMAGIPIEGSFIVTMVPDSRTHE